MKQKESPILRFCYHTIPGRILLRVLISPSISKLCGLFMDCRASAVFIPFFRRANAITMKGVEIPKGGFSSFNAFFCRKQRRTIGDAALLSPCDGLLTSIPIHGNQIFDIKHTRFSLEDLLHDRTLAKEFENGTALVFRLTPAHYHRYAYAADGEILHWRRISGVLHTVRPICTRQVPVFAQNAREYQVILTKEHGKLVQMEIGAMLIGRITNEAPYGKRAIRGREKGKFEFGGSTILLLLQKDAAELQKKFLEAGRDGGELPVTYGENLI